MGKFNKTGKRGMPELNTSSLPDLIFTMLFFFMIVTTMREVTLKVQFTLPVCFYVISFYDASAFQRKHFANGSCGNGLGLRGIVGRFSTCL